MAELLRDRRIVCRIAEGGARLRRQLRLLTKSSIFRGLCCIQGFVVFRVHAEKGGGGAEEMEFVSIGTLVPGDHLLRKIDAAVDFEFIRERVRLLYCADNGRPSLDPVVLFKLLFVG